MLAQPLHPEFFGPDNHRIDVPEGIIQIESDRADLVGHGCLRLGRNRFYAKGKSHPPPLSEDSVSEFHLVIGNKNYSSWSLRPWILMRRLGIQFRETLVPLDT